MAESTTKPPRLPSLDLVRGLTVAGMIVVNASAVLEYARKPVFPVLLHTPWTGFSGADAVFPAFITMVGVSIAISARPGGLPASRILWRALRLILLGLFLVNMFLLIVPDLAWPPRFPGVLQRIGLVYAAAAFAYPRTSTRTRAWLAAAILLAYWGLCTAPIPDGSVTDLWAQGHSFVCWIDRAVFGSWVQGKGAAGYDPEGIAGTFSAFAQALIGTVAGDVLRRRLPIPQVARGLALAGACGIALGLAWDRVYPISKPLWTGSFVLLSSGITLLLLGLFHLACDGRPAGAKGGPLGSLGRNAITAYALHYLLLNLLATPPFLAPIAMLAPITGDRVAALAPVALFFVLIWAPMALMDRRGWYVKI